MKDKTIKLTGYAGNGPYSWYGDAEFFAHRTHPYRHSTGIDLCGEGMHDKVVFPANAKYVWLVLSTRERANSFQITKTGTLKGAGYIMSYTENSFKELYNEGYRYVKLKYYKTEYTYV
jgi:hypothetical protein